MSDKFWMIVDTAGATEQYDGLCLEKNKRPGYMHTDNEKAEKELLRLQKRYPDGQFVLLEAVAVAVPRIVTEYSLQPINDGIPF